MSSSTRSTSPICWPLPRFYKDWAKWGGGLTNYLSYGEFPTKGYGQPEPFKYPRGVVLNRDLSHVYPVNATDSQEIKEYIAHSWYSYDGGDNEGIHPWAGETKLNYTGPKPPFETLEGYEKYSFLKTPRWKEQPDGSGSAGAAARRLCLRPHRCAGAGEGHAGQAQRPVAALFSTLGRTAARGLDAALAMIWLKEFYGQLMERVKINEVSTFNGEFWEPKSWPKDAEGVGLTEAPRGALAHWIKIHNGAIENYQLVVPTTWNGSPRDAKQQRSLLRAGADRHAGGEARRAGRDPPHHPFL